MTRIIAVDDDARTLRLLVDVLGSASQVLTFDDPAIALSYLSDVGGADLLIIDIEMPAIDGFALARAVREIPALSEMPILALTGATERDIAVRILEAGADAYLRKPVDIADLRSVTRRLVDETAHG